MHIVMYGGEGQLLKPLHRRDACSSLVHDNNGDFGDGHPCNSGESIGEGATGAIAPPVRGS